MDDMPLVIKVVEVVIMELLVGAAIIALLIAAVRDVVEARVQEARRRDQIALESEEQKPVSAQPGAPQPTPQGQQVLQQPR
ncbi:MAG: hypothetical protein N2204_08860 [Anaerolineae bacterium]|nr:hypothetical protein [Anaerolineae bacterium]